VVALKLPGIASGFLGEGAVLEVSCSLSGRIVASCIGPPFGFEVSSGDPPLQVAMV
jgi:hypothetical protein